VIHWGLDLISIYNDAFVPLIGDAHPLLLGNSVNAFPELWRVTGEIVAGVMDTGQPAWHDDLLFHIEQRNQVQERHAQASFSPVWNDSGEVGGVCCLLTDTTARVIAERQLQTLVQLNARISNTRAQVDVCRAAADALRLDPQDIPFVSIYLIDEASNEARLCSSAGIEPGNAASPFVMRMEGSGMSAIAKAARNGKKEIVDSEDICAGLPRGPWRISPRSIAVLPLSLPGSPKPTGMIVAGLNPYRNIDEDYRSFLEQIATSTAKAIAASNASKEQRKRVDLLAELDRSKIEFFTTVSHEFRTPLTLMLGPVEEMLRNPEEPFSGQRKGIEIVHRNAQRLLKLVNSLLDFSTMETGRAQAFYEPVDLAGYTAELASGFRSAIEHVGLRFTVDCPVLEESVYVDRDLWEKLLLNLLSNALKFTLAGEIGISLRQLGRKVELSVWDTGVGIPSHELVSVFEKFHRVEGTRGRTAEGSGIGLAMVKEVAKIHGGSVRVDSTIGEGSQFTVSIPMGSAHLPAERVGSSRIHALPPAATEMFTSEAMAVSGNSAASTQWLHEKAAPKTRPTVLVVEDNADMREYVRRLLSSEYEVFALSDGEAALTFLREVRPDLVLTDITMPRINGVNLLRSIRLNPNTSALPVIVLSGEVSEDSKIEALEAGANDYLTKPFSARELMARIAAQVKLAQSRM
jgi:signal transduction histidine kinase/ActR/RegA family two-component response regulator